MRAALIREIGGAPEVGEVAKPAGESMEVLAAPINPIDLAVSRGILATGHPDFPTSPVVRPSVVPTTAVWSGSLADRSGGRRPARSPKRVAIG